MVLDLKILWEAERDERRYTSLHVLAVNEKSRYPLNTDSFHALAWLRYSFTQHPCNVSALRNGTKVIEEFENANASLLQDRNRRQLPPAERYLYSIIVQLQRSIGLSDH